MSQPADEDLLRRLLESYPRDLLRGLVSLAEESRRRGRSGDARPWTATVEIEFGGDGRVEVARLPRVVEW